VACRYRATGLSRKANPVDFMPNLLTIARLPGGIFHEYFPLGRYQISIDGTHTQRAKHAALPRRKRPSILHSPPSPALCPSSFVLGLLLVSSSGRDGRGSTSSRPHPSPMLSLEDASRPTPVVVVLVRSAKPHSPLPRSKVSVG
jgi:hypothetical protein